MRELRFVEPGRLDWYDAPEPELGSDLAALVRPIAVAGCDLDLPIVAGQTPVVGPFPVGHEVVAEVIEVGAAVRDVAPGDRVSVAFQISCGNCVRCRRGETGRCQSVPAGSSYGMGQLGRDRSGAIADVLHVPYADAMCLTLPADVDSVAIAALGDNLTDAWRTVAPHVKDAMEPRVLVHGNASIGLYATASALVLGAEVTYADPDQDNCAVAERLGATVECRSLDARTRSHPIVVNSCADEASLRSALRSTQAGGVLTDTGIFFGNDVSLPMLEMYAKGITLVTGRADVRPDMPAVLAEVAAGRLRADLIVGRTAGWEQAPQVWGTPGGKLVLVRDQ
jgi:threonine dehydrogenase-like Zn-dependent dehydrogenase